MTIKQSILSDVNSLFSAGLAIDITHHYGASQETLKAFFDESYEATFEGALPVGNEFNRILVETALAGNITRSSSFDINSKTYYVYAIHTDQEGITEIILSEDQAG